MAEFLSYDDVLRIHFRLVDFFASAGDPITPPGPRDENLLHSACLRPHTSLGGVEKYPGIEDKAAALLHSLVANHPFHNGNKRTALASSVSFLDRNDRRIEATDDEIFDLVTGVAKGSLPGGLPPATVDDLVEQIQRWISAHTSTFREKASDMRVTEFLDSCRSAGAHVKLSSDSNRWIIRGPRGSIRIARKTRQLAGMVIQKYLQTLGLSEALGGIRMEEFQEGMHPEQELIMRLQRVLRRLAYA